MVSSQSHERKLSHLLHCGLEMQVFQCTLTARDKLGGTI